MTNYLVKTEQEPEYKVNPSLKISSVGAEIKKNSSQMPDGSALLTDTGSSSNLKNQGINYIIHAVPRHRSNCASDEEFIEIAVKAAQNSIILADREGIGELAICLIGGERYRGSCDPKKLAREIVKGSLNQLEKCQNLERISFIDWGGSADSYFLEAYEKEFQDVGDLFGGAVARDGNAFGKLKSNPKKFLGYSKGDICNKKFHGASAIVNSENAGMNWGGGISEAIQKALGSEANGVDQQRKDLMKEFNKLINQSGEEDNQEEGNNNTKKHTVVVQRKGASVVWSDTAKDNVREDSFYTFEIKDKQKAIMANYHHPAFTNNRPKETKTPEKKETIVWYKISFKGDINKMVHIGKDDFFEIEEIKGSNGQTPPVQGNDENHDQNSPTKKDNGQNSDDQNENNNNNGDKGQKNPSNSNGSNDNNSDKNKNSPNPNIPNSVKKYFQKNGVQSVELDGENWIITYKDKSRKKTFQKANIQELQGLEDYLKLLGKKTLTDEEIKNSSNANSSTGKGNETKYWPWILGIGGGILVIGIVVWAVLKNRKKK